MLPAFMAAWLPYLVAIAATLAAALWRLILAHWLGSDLPYLTFYGAIMAAAWYGGLRPGLLATALSAAITATFFLLPRIEAVGLKPAHVVGILIFTATGWLISAGADALRRTREGHRLEAERLRTTLQSIGDGVIVTDAAARVVLAERGRRAPHRLVERRRQRPRARRDLPHRQRGHARSRSTTRPCGRCATARSSASPTTPS